jgi:hypothetical protein
VKPAASVVRAWHTAAHPVHIDAAVLNGLYLDAASGKAIPLVEPFTLARPCNATAVLVDTNSTSVGSHPELVPARARCSVTSDTLRAAHGVNTTRLLEDSLRLGLGSLEPNRSRADWWWDSVPQFAVASVQPRALALGKGHIVMGRPTTRVLVELPPPRYTTQSLSEYRRIGRVPLRAILRAAALVRGLARPLRTPRPDSWQRRFNASGFGSLCVDGWSVEPSEWFRVTVAWMVR